MRRPSRIRRWLKWVGATVCVLLLMMWVFSIWGCVSATFPAGNAMWRISLCNQFLGFGWRNSILPGQSGWFFYWVREATFTLRLPRLFTFPSGSRGQIAKEFFLPLWIPFLFVTTPTAFFFWRDRRQIPQGHCQKCGYNLTGNTSGICPECGGPI